MAKKKKKQMRETLYCPYCKRPGVLRPAAYVYGDNNLDPEKYLYVCSGYPSCDSYIGAHKKSMRPMGTMADSNLRNKRIEAHRALDAIWKNGYMTKHSTYIWLQNRLNLREKDTHIGKFSYYLCEQTILSNLQREGDVSCHLKCLKEEAKSREPNLADSLQEHIQREFISRVAQLYYKKQLVIDNIRREDCLEANGTSVLAQAV